MASVNVPLPFDAYQGSEPYVFVSYAHKDGAAVYPLLKELHDLGYRVWYDEGIDPGNEWPEEIARALLGASHFLVFLTGNAVNSRNVKNEINYALNESKPFLAIHLEEMQLPPGLALRMGDIQAVMKWRVSSDHYQRVLRRALPDNLCRTTAEPAVARPSGPAETPPASSGGESPVSKQARELAEILNLPDEQFAKVRAETLDNAAESLMTPTRRLVHRMKKRLGLGKPIVPSATAKPAPEESPTLPFNTDETSVTAVPPVTPVFQRNYPKVARNDPCTCGSGKKYKKCCGAADFNSTKTEPALSHPSLVSPAATETNPGKQADPSPVTPTVRPAQASSQNRSRTAVAPPYELVLLKLDRAFAKGDVACMVRQCTGKDRAKSLEMVDRLPSIVLSSLTQVAAEKLQKEFKDVGATAQVLLRQDYTSQPRARHRYAGAGASAQLIALGEVGSNRNGIAKVLREHTDLSPHDVERIVYGASTIISIICEDVYAKSLCYYLRDVGASASVL